MPDSALAALLDLVLPRCCAGCERPGSRLCPTCRELLRARPLGQVRPDPCPPGMPLVSTLARYDGPVKRLLLAHKERAGLYLTGPLGAAVAAVVASLDPGPLVLCPVPSSPQAVRDRGYDHTWRLARTAAGRLRRDGAPVVARRLLLAARAAADQSGLTSGQRARNLQGALTGRGGPAVRVVVVDDVVTTGATLAEAARALAADGHEVLGAVVVAATARRVPSRATSSG